MSNSRPVPPPAVRVKPWRLCPSDLRKGCAFSRSEEPLLFFFSLFAPHLPGRLEPFRKSPAAEPPAKSSDPLSSRPGGAHMAASCHVCDLQGSHSRRGDQNARCMRHPSMFDPVSWCGFPGHRHCRRRKSPTWVTDVAINLQRQEQARRQHQRSHRNMGGGDRDNGRERLRGVPGR